MKIQKGNKKILIIISCLLMLLIPYLAVVNPLLKQLKGLKTELYTLEYKRNKLASLNQDKDYYIEETKKTEEKIDMLLKEFPENITQEKSLTLVNNMETMFPIEFSKVHFTKFSEQELFEKTTETNKDTNQEIVENFEKVMATTEFTFRCDYNSMKNLLYYLEDYQEPISIKQFDISFGVNQDTITGKFTLTQYGINSIK